MTPRRSRPPRPAASAGPAARRPSRRRARRWTALLLAAGVGPATLAPLAPIALAPIALAPVALAPVVLAQEPDTTRRDELQREIETYRDLQREREAEIARLRGALGETRAQIEARLAERDRLSARIVDLREQRAALQGEIEELGGRLAATQERIAGLEADLESLEVRIRALLIDLYRQRAGRFAGVLGTAESFHDLRVRNHYLAVLSERDAELVEQLDATLAELFDAQTELSATIEEREAKRQELAAAEAELEASRASLESVIAELRSTEAGQDAARAAALEAQSELEATLLEAERDLAAEVARIERELAEIEQRRRQQEFLDRQAEARRQAELDARAETLRGARDALTGAASGFSLPFDPASVSIGYRERNNSYVALRGPTDYSAVRSMQAGSVERVSLLSANEGYMVAIRHGPDLLVGYTNLQRPTLRAGDVVAQGDVIGYVGGSAILPPDELRLYVWRDMAFVDPAAVLGL